MSISPGLIAVPLTGAPGLQTPASIPANEAVQGSGASPKADFEAMMGNGAAKLQAPQSGTSPQAYRAGSIARGGNLGDQVLGSLEKLGHSVEAMGKMGSVPASKLSKAPSAGIPSANTPSANASSANAPSPAPAAKDAAQKPGGADMSDLRAMWETGMQHQKQLYATVFEFELVQESAQSMLKSLKSLLTQGGG